MSSPAARWRCRNICGTRATGARSGSATARATSTRTIIPEHFVAQDYLGADKRYYEPTEQGVEKKIKERVEKWRAQFAKAGIRGARTEGEK